MTIRTSFTHPLVVLDLFPLSIPRQLSFFCKTHEVILILYPQLSSKWNKSEQIVSKWQ